MKKQRGLVQVGVFCVITSIVAGVLAATYQFDPRCQVMVWKIVRYCRGDTSCDPGPGKPAYDKDGFAAERM